MDEYAADRLIQSLSEWADYHLPTRRERIATALMAGVCANAEFEQQTYEESTEIALSQTDSLIAELDKEAKP